VKLLVPREEAIRKIKEQIQIGREIRDQKSFSMMDSGNAQEKRIEWVEENIELLTDLFDHPVFKEEYNADLSPDMGSAITFGLKEKYFKEDMDEQIERLEAILERLKFIPETIREERPEQKPAEERYKEHPSRRRPSKEDPSKEVLHRKAVLRDEPPPPIGKSESILEHLISMSESKREERVEQRPAEELFKEHPSRKKPPHEDPSKEVLTRKEMTRNAPSPPIVPNPPLPTGGSILLIHGRDAGAKDSVLKFIEQLGLRALTLQEQPNGGRSIAERSGELSHTQFAIILFTPDEIAVSRDKSKERQVRVSQHVMFEFGYVVAKLGNRRVCVLYDEGVEIPSEVSGVVSIPMDFRGGWRLLVAREFKQAGVEVDLNKAL
jgi:predicted nucleotide-binding protein